MTIAARLEQFGALLVVVLGAGLVVASGTRSQLGPALADEHFYLADARHFADSGGLDARFYDQSAILAFGHPHHDSHTPGYVLLLGAAIRLVGGTYKTAVGLNALAYIGLALLVRALTRALDLAPPAPLLAGILALLLPAFLPYVFWVMAEVVLGFLFVAALVTAARHGNHHAGAIGAALLLGIGLLVRESLLLGLPAFFGLLVARRGRWRTAAVALLLFVPLVYLPLQRGRAGGARFWQVPLNHPASGGGASMIQAAVKGRPIEALQLAWKRAASNVRQFADPSVDPAEKAILGYFAIVALAALRAARSTSPLGRGLLAGLCLGFGATVGLLFLAYTIGNWAGPRYLMFLMPAFLPFVAAPVAQAPTAHASARPWLVPATLVAVGMLLAYQVLLRFSDYKASRQRRWERLTAYVEGYVDGRHLSRVVLPNGWLFGLKYYPVEVISSLIDDGGHLRALEGAVGFDYLIVPGTYNMVPEIETRTRYRRVNGGEPDPPLYIYRRVK